MCVCLSIKTRIVDLHRKRKGLEDRYLSPLYFIAISLHLVFVVRRTVLIIPQMPLKYSVENVFGHTEKFLINFLVHLLYLSPSYLFFSAFFQWENVGDFYYGRIIKLQISCRTKIDPHEQTDCFLFKSKGHQILGKKIVLEKAVSLLCDMFSVVYHQVLVKISQLRRSLGKNYPVLAQQW